MKQVCENKCKEPVSKKRKEPASVCIFCGKEEGIPFKDSLVCEECLDYIKKIES